MVFFDLYLCIYWDFLAEFRLLSTSLRPHLDMIRNHEDSEVFNNREQAEIEALICPDEVELEVTNVELILESLHSSIVSYDKLKTTFINTVYDS